MNKTIYSLATIAGFIVGVVSYFYTALLLLWDEHGDDIVERYHLLVSDTFQAYQDVNALCKDLAHWYTTLARPLVGRSVDQLYFRAIDM